MKATIWSNTTPVQQYAYSNIRFVKFADKDLPMTRLYKAGSECKKCDTPCVGGCLNAILAAIVPKEYLIFLTEHE